MISYAKISESRQVNNLRFVSLTHIRKCPKPYQLPRDNSVDTLKTLKISFPTFDA